MRLSLNHYLTSGGRGECAIDDHEQEDRVGWSERAKRCADGGAGGCFGDGSAPPHEQSEADGGRVVLFVLRIVGRRPLLLECR
jgi:hypothetical protein